MNEKLIWRRVYIAFLFLGLCCIVSPCLDPAVDAKKIPKALAGGNIVKTTVITSAPPPQPASTPKSIANDGYVRQAPI